MSRNNKQQNGPHRVTRRNVAKGSFYLNKLRSTLDARDVVVENFYRRWMVGWLTNRHIIVNIETQRIPRNTANDEKGQSG